MFYNRYVGARDNVGKACALTIYTRDSYGLNEQDSFQ